MGLEYSPYNTTPYDIDFGGPGAWAPPPAGAIGASMPDPTYKFEAFCDYTTAGTAAGGGLLNCYIDGPCNNSKRIVWKTQTIIAGLTAGPVPGGYADFNTSFDYYGDISAINESTFEGFSWVITGGLAYTNWGISWTNIKMGSVLSRGPGRQKGLDIGSLDAFLGHTIVVDSWSECCD